jgi:hypothetical protein
MNRIERMEYLHRRMRSERNPEQAEAYAERLNQHWRQFMCDFEKEIKNETKV